MEEHNIVLWIGAVSLFLSSSGVAYIGLRRTDFGQRTRMVHGNLTDFEKRIAKLSGIFFVFSIMALLIGAVLKFK